MNCNNFSSSGPWSAVRTGILSVHESEYQSVPSEKTLRLYMQRVADSGMFEVTRDKKGYYHLIAGPNFRKIMTQLDSISPQEWRIDNDKLRVETIWGVGLYTPRGINQYRSFFSRLDIPVEEGELAEEALSRWTMRLTKKQLKSIVRVKQLFDKVCDINEYYYIIDQYPKTICNPNIWSSRENALTQSVLDRIFNPLWPWNDLNVILRCSGSFGPGSVAEKSSLTNELTKVVFACRHYQHGSCVTPSRPVLVPKSWKTKRVIAPEPAWNSYYQHAVSNAFRKVVTTCLPLDFTNQERNRVRCNMDYATIDSSAASDSVRLAHVQILLPDWARLLTLFRTGCVSYPRLSKISTFATMGSPNTFDVETVIFYMIAATAIYKECKRLRIGWREMLDAIHDLAVYGDDIVVQCRFYSAVCKLLKECGFIVNESKSYGSFMVGYRETCGAETYCNVDIAPVRVARGQPVDWVNCSDPLTIADFANELARHELFETTKDFVEGYNANDQRKKPHIKLGTTWDRSVLDIREYKSDLEHLKYALRSYSPTVRASALKSYVESKSSLFQEEFDPLMVYSPLSAYSESVGVVATKDKVSQFVLDNREALRDHYGDLPASIQRKKRLRDTQLHGKTYVETSFHICDQHRQLNITSSREVSYHTPKSEIFNDWSNRFLTFKSGNGRHKRIVHDLDDRVDYLGHVHFTEEEWDTFAKDFILAKLEWSHMVADAKLVNLPISSRECGDLADALSTLRTPVNLGVIDFGQPSIFYTTPCIEVDAE